VYTTEQQPGGIASPEARAEVRDGQIRLLYAQAAGTFLATLSAAVVAAVLLWRALPGAQVAVWLACGIALTLSRFVLLSAYRRIKPAGADIDRWGGYFTIGSAMAALFWGSAAFVLFVPGEADYDAFVVILISGMMAGGVFSLAAYGPTFHAFILPVGVALLVRLATLAGFDTDYELTMLALAALVALFVPFLYFFGRHARTNLVKLLESQWSNRRLTDTLAAKLAELEQSNRLLEAENRARMTSENVLRQNQ
jgi:hypothetical protein